MLFSLIWLTRIGISFSAGALSDTVGRYPVLIGALFSSTVGLAFITFGRAIWLFPGTVMLAAGFGATFPVGVALVSDHVPGSQRGLAIGVFETTGGRAFVAASALGGVLADRFDPRAPYWAAVLFCASGAGLMLVRRSWFLA